MNYYKSHLHYNLVQNQISFPHDHSTTITQTGTYIYQKDQTHCEKSPIEKGLTSIASNVHLYQENGEISQPTDDVESKDAHNSNDHINPSNVLTHQQCNNNSTSCYLKLCRTTQQEDALSKLYVSESKHLLNNIRADNFIPLGNKFMSIPYLHSSCLNGLFMESIPPDKMLVFHKSTKSCINDCETNSCAMPSSKVMIYHSSNNSSTMVTPTIKLRHNTIALSKEYKVSNEFSFLDNASYSSFNKTRGVCLQRSVNEFLQRFFHSQAKV